MKAIIKNIFLLFILFSASVFAQQNRWLDANLKETDQLNSVYYTIISSDASEENYFYKNGKIYRKVKYSSQKLSANFSEFYETGALKVSGKYENGFKEGIWKTYYKNGKMKERGKYKSGEKVGIWKAFYKNF
tara:strand:- start:105 stop:500 length:396 start_codon:yes stop_codon:yes gene_type:complete